MPYVAVAESAIRLIEQGSAVAGPRVAKAIDGIVGGMRFKVPQASGPGTRAERVLEAYTETAPMMAVMLDLFDATVSAENRDALSGVVRGIENIASARSPRLVPGPVPQGWEHDVQRFLVLEMVQAFAAVCVDQGRLGMAAELLDHQFELDVEHRHESRSLGELWFSEYQTIEDIRVTKQWLWWAVWPYLIQERYLAAPLRERLSPQRLREGDTFLAFASIFQGLPEDRRWPAWLLWLDDRNATQEVGPIRWLSRCRSKRALSELAKALSIPEAKITTSYEAHRHDVLSWFKGGHTIKYRLKEWLIEPDELGSVP